MSRKDLDLELISKELKKRQNGDREIKRQMMLLDQMTKVSAKFQVTEEEDEIIVIRSGQELPSDEELEAMKQQLAEQDKIEREREFQALPWWKRLLFKIGLLNAD